MEASKGRKYVAKICLFQLVWCMLYQSNHSLPHWNSDDYMTFDLPFKIKAKNYSIFATRPRRWNLEGSFIPIIYFKYMFIYIFFSSSSKFGGWIRSTPLGCCPKILFISMLKDITWLCDIKIFTEVQREISYYKTLSYFCLNTMV